MTVLEDFIRCRQKANETAIDEARQNALIEFRKYVAELREFIDADIDSDDPWEGKYDYIFSKEVSQGKVKDFLAQTNLRLDYYDPDMSCEDDVRAYVDALEDLVEEPNGF